MFKKILKIQKQKIGNKEKIFIIAEIGVNHCGKINLAKKMIDSAKRAGADAVKFQTFTAENLALQSTKKVNYQLRNTAKKESHYEMLKSLELTKKDYKILFNYCKKKKILFLSTPYDVESAKFLNKLGCKVFKTASADIVDLVLHDYLAKTKKTVIISTGMSNISEVEECLKIYKKYKNYNIVLLHCVSNYPCSQKSINLNSIITLKNKFGCLVGYSDHSLGNQAINLSVALGAVIIEKHFTINRNLPGPDQKTSILPQELKQLIKEVKNSKIILGDYIKKCQLEELEMYKVSRKSLTLNSDLKKNQILKKKYLTLKRPGTGIFYNDIKKVLGKRLRKNLKKNYQINLKDLKA